jgi:Zn-dependent protease with chaperone function
MNFWESQDRARRGSRILVLYFAAAVLFIILSIYLAVALAFGMAGEGGHGWWHPELFAWIAIGTAGLIGLGSLFKSLSLRSGGGGQVARSLGGRAVDPNTSDPHEKRLVNIVEEMALASGIHVPEIYVLPEERGINAFAAGHSPDDAAVAVTRGCMEQLTRDELQGVVAHEFAHILNGDMRLNIRLIGLVFGILLIALFGRILLHSMRFGSMSNRRGKGGGGMAAIALLGLLLLIIGYVGVLFGRLIQAAVSRQREFLADAAAVQFTRNPDGIGGALKRIGGWSSGSSVINAHAAETSHLFFANAMAASSFNVFATHPPLETRIKAIDPTWNPATAKREPPPLPPEPKPPPPPPPPRGGGRSPFEALNQAGALTAAAVAATSSLLSRIPEPLKVAAHEPSGARLLLASLLLDADPAARGPQNKILSGRIGPAAPEQSAALRQRADAAGPQARLALLDLALPSLRRLPLDERRPTADLLRELALADGAITVFELAILKTAGRSLRWHEPEPAPQIFRLNAVAVEIAQLLAATASAAGGSAERKAQAYAAGVRRLPEIAEGLQTAARARPEDLEAVIDRLDQASLPIKKRVLEACAEAVASDGKVDPAEEELLRAIAGAFGCPLPRLGG